MFNVVSFNVGFVSFNVVVSKVINHKHFMNYILVMFLLFQVKSLNMAALFALVHVSTLCQIKLMNPALRIS